MDNKDFFDAEVESPTNPPPDEGVEIPVRSKIRESLEKARDEGRDVVDEYEQRYYGSRPPKPQEDKMLAVPKRYQRAVRTAPANVTEDEKLWAAIAHASTILTIGMLVLTAGVGSLVTLFIPFAIYLVYRNKSEFVANHALQAFAAQVVGTIGFVALGLAIGLAFSIMLVISAILIVVLVGIVLLPIVLIVGVVALAATLLVPLAVLIYSMIGAVDAFEGRYFKYPWIGDWVDGHMYEG